MDGGKFETTESVEKVVVAGVHKAPTKVTLNKEKNVEFQYDSAKHTVTLKKPGVLAAAKWSIELKL